MNEFVDFRDIIRSKRYLYQIDISRWIAFEEREVRASMDPLKLNPSMCKDGYGHQFLEVPTLASFTVMDSCIKRLRFIFARAAWRQRVLGIYISHGGVFNSSPHVLTEYRKDISSLVADPKQKIWLYCLNLSYNS